MACPTNSIVQSGQPISIIMVDQSLLINQCLASYNCLIGPHELEGPALQQRRTVCSLTAVAGPESPHR